MRLDVRNHEIMIAILLGIDDILDEALHDRLRLTKEQAIDFLERLKVVTDEVNVIDERVEDT